MNTTIENAGWNPTTIEITSQKQYDEVMAQYDALGETLNDQGHVIPDEHDAERDNLRNALMNFNYSHATTNANGKDVAANRRRNRETRQ